MGIPGRARRASWRALLLPLLIASAQPTRAADQEKKPPPAAAGRPAPPFTLADVSGKKRSPLNEYRERRIVLFFFCGCSWCYEVATEWARLQRGGALEAEGATRAAAPAKAPVTVVVYTGLEATSARVLATGAGLDPAQTLLLPDPDKKVTETAYRAEPCPRAFVVDGRGFVRYSNTRKEDAPREAPAAAIVAAALDALNALKEAPAKGAPR